MISRIVKTTLLDGERWAIETKLTASPSLPDLRRVREAAALIDARRCVMISRTPEPVEGDSVISTNLPAFLAMLAGR